MVSPVDRSRRLFLCASLLALACRKIAPQGGVAAPGVTAARRIVSLAPPITDTLFALGVGERVVGVSQLCDLPAAARLPRVGTMVTPSYDAIVALRPDAIVAVEGPVRDEVIARLRDAGIRPYAPRFETLSDVRAALPTLATLGGRPAAAATLRASIDAGLARVRNALQGRPRPRVIAVCAQTPLVLAAQSSWVGELLSLAGGDNPVRGNSAYPIWSVEQVMSQVPEVVIDLSGAEPALAAAWAEQRAIPAVATGRVRRLDGPLVRRQGPRVVDAVRALAAVLHPGVAL